MNRRDLLKDSFLLTGLLAVSSKTSFGVSKTTEEIKSKRKAVIRKVAQLGNDILRVKTKEITDTDILRNIFLGNLIDDMLITLNDSGGVGLASSQIFEESSLFVFINDMEKSYVEIVINPKITGFSKIKAKGYEGCLSIPEIRALVPRYEWIDVEYIDGSNKKIKRRYSGFIARIFQHEFDHLNGKVYLDRVESNVDIISEEEYHKLPEESKKR